MEDTREDPPGSDPGHAADFVGQERLNASDLSRGQPELVVGHAPYMLGLSTTSHAMGQAVYRS